MDVTDIRAIGFFDLDEEQQSQYTDYIFEAVENTFIEERKRYGHFTTLQRIVEQIEWMVKEFMEEEDYEMCYLLNNSKKKLRKKYGQKDRTTRIPPTES